MKPARPPEELLKERTKRVADAIQVKVPDRVPIIPFFAFFPAKYAHITCQDAFYDAVKWKSACRQTIVDFEPDMHSVASIVPGPVLDALECQQVKLPGHGVSPHSTHQFVEREYMRPGEYEAFLYDQSDYAVRTYIPRLYGTLGALSKLPPLRYLLFGYSESMATEMLTEPEFVHAFDSLAKAGHEMINWNAVMGTFNQEMAELGFPAYSASRTLVPYDLLSDYHRGMRGSMIDLYRQPDKILEACQKLLPLSIDKGISAAKKSGNPRIFIPLHRGAEGFMSLKQFETFYWPTLKKLILAVIESGLTPCPFFEGDYTSRLEYLLELPKGKVMAYFDTTDIFKAKQILGNHLCIMGNVPASILQTGTPQDVKDCCKKLIDVVGKNGGYIMAPRGAIDEARPENVRAMFDFTREYGVYR